MQSALDRRQAIVDAMIERRMDTVPNLAHEFNVAQATIRRDLCILSRTNPIIAIRGHGGGIRYLGKDALGKCPLTTDEVIFLHELRHRLSSEEGRELKTILHKLFESWTSG